MFEKQTMSRAEMKEKCPRASRDGLREYYWCPAMGGIEMSRYYGRVTKPYDYRAFSIRSALQEKTLHWTIGSDSSDSAVFLSYPRNYLGMDRKKVKQLRRNRIASNTIPLFLTFRGGQSISKQI